MPKLKPMLTPEQNYRKRPKLKLDADAKANETDAHAKADEIKAN
jgi:hypothetical protein